MPSKILVVCTGNICRSPIGERFLRALLPHKNVDSAGTAALINHGADEDAQRIAKKFGVSLDGHKGRQFTPELSVRYDLILVMEKAHFSQITRIAPEARSKSLLLGHWFNQMEIPDPWHKSDEAFEHIFRLIDRSCQAWAGKITGKI
ncbi:protein tyrosine phosphatase [Enterobacter sp. CC120223-11]|uniref:arsenate reductase/protein-tyrosine-phosphatase family protein n=1 Tax=Enterobacter sp. CC120223-11 TaxID=1378073 RepID=UPI000BC94F93|nr:protein tyrosine phosphatase [Enterobacter sp. CC120223-11]SNY66738.1 protein-tyrosine phosphatase [Enterobacter sp. CC120223-11]